MDVDRVSRRVFFSVSALVFVTSAAATAVLCESMSAMGEMQMPGGWTMSMMWMRMPGQTWAAVVAAFVGMWTVMMVAMMLPSVAPMMWRYRESAAGAGVAHQRGLTALVGLGYFFVWTALGIAVFLVGAAVAAIELQQPALARTVPIVGGVLMLIAGWLQFTSWKARHLVLCRDASEPSHTFAASARVAWRHGVCIGLKCSYSCAPLTACLLVVGVNNFRAMTLVATAITAERLAPQGLRIARGSGVAVIAAGLLLIAKAVGR